MIYRIDDFINDEQTLAQGQQLAPYKLPIHASDHPVARCSSSHRIEREEARSEWWARYDDDACRAAAFLKDHCDKPTKVMAMQAKLDETEAPTSDVSNSESSDDTSSAESTHDEAQASEADAIAASQTLVFSEPIFPKTRTPDNTPLTGKDWAALSLFNLRHALQLSQR
jgi:hypothetical protein